MLTVNDRAKNANDRQRQTYRAEGLAMAHDIAGALLDEIIKEHASLPPDWLGRPRKHHHRLLGGSRVLKELGARLVASQKKIIDGYENG